MNSDLSNNVSLKQYNTFGIDVAAKYFAGFKDIEELKELVDSGNKIAATEAISTSPLILGGGSNILFTGDFNGIVFQNNISGIAITGEDEDHVYVRAGAGESWHKLVLFCLDRNLGGVENLALIPGSVGASPMQNIGAYGVEIKDVFDSLEAYHLQEKEFVSFNAFDCAFGYRESIFKNKYRNQFVITSVQYRLNKHPVFNTSYGAIESELEQMKITEPGIKAIAQAVINIRQSKLPDPKVTGNAGSFFKNPIVSKVQYDNLKMEYPGIVGYVLGDGNVKLAAGWLIEECGWRGYRKGDAGCHPKQALVLVNYGKATGTEIFDLSAEIIRSVQNKFLVGLTREVNII